MTDIPLYIFDNPSVYKRYCIDSHIELRCHVKGDRLFMIYRDSLYECNDKDVNFLENCDALHHIKTLKILKVHSNIMFDTNVYRITFTPVIAISLYFYKN